MATQKTITGRKNLFWFLWHVNFSVSGVRFVLLLLLFWLVHDSVLIFSLLLLCSFLIFLFAFLLGLVHQSIGRSCFTTNCFKLLFNFYWRLRSNIGIAFLHFCNWIALWQGAVITGTDRVVHISAMLKWKCTQKVSFKGKYYFHHSHSPLPPKKKNANLRYLRLTALLTGNMTADVMREKRPLHVWPKGGSPIRPR